MKIKPIRTSYNGIYFRSKLEAEWAKFFDSMGIKYIYEPDGYELSDGTKYLPDFYLPDANQWFEVKGVMTDIDMHKIKMLAIESEKEIVIGYSNGEFQHLELYMYDEAGNPIAELASKEESILNKCRNCGGLSFFNGWGSWHCRCKGCYDGDHYCSTVMSGDGSGGSLSTWIRNAKIDVMQNMR